MEAKVLADWLDPTKSTGPEETEALRVFVLGLSAPLRELALAYPPGTVVDAAPIGHAMVLNYRDFGAVVVLEVAPMLPIYPMHPTAVTCGVTRGAVRKVIGYHAGVTQETIRSFLRELS
jgi:hypothetical protein